jgi:crossover junction endodeoxyribonuclease RuvC
MLVIGIDPGTAIMGYGVIREEGQKFEAVDYGVVRTSPTLPMAERLLFLYEELSLIIAKYKPTVAVVEELFFSKNVRTALAVGQARGTAIVAAAKQGLDVREYTPLQVKQAVVGYGKASKEQVQEMVKMLLHLPEMPQPDDAADALAIALCHLHTKDFEALAARGR